jgi:hypothetical protein
VIGRHYGIRSRYDIAAVAFSHVKIDRCHAKKHQIYMTMRGITVDYHRIYLCMQ